MRNQVQLIADVDRLAGDLEVPVILGGRAVGFDDRYAAHLGADGAFTDIGTAIRVLEGWLDTPPTTVLHAPSMTTGRGNAPSSAPGGWRA